MRAISLLIYFAIPAVVVTTIGAGADRPMLVLSQMFQSFFPNYLMFAAPQLLWFGICSMFRFSAASFHFGFLAASVTLVSMHLRFECCVDNSNAFGWLHYWPIATLLMLGGLGVECVTRRRLKDASERHEKMKRNCVER